MWLTLMLCACMGVCSTKANYQAINWVLHPLLAEASCFIWLGVKCKNNVFLSVWINSNKTFCFQAEQDQMLFFWFTDTHFQEEKSHCPMALVLLSAVMVSSSPMPMLWPTREASVWSSPTERCTMPPCRMLIRWQTLQPSKSLQKWATSYKNIYWMDSAFYASFYFTGHDNT